MSEKDAPIGFFSWSLALGVGCTVGANVLFIPLHNHLALDNLLPIAFQVCLVIGLLLIFTSLGFRKTLTHLSDELRTVSKETSKNVASMAQLYCLQDGSEKLGLVEISSDCSTYDYNEVLVEAQQLTLVMNDGRTWASVHRDRLRKRFADPSKRTTFFVCHPDSPMVSILARKGSTDEATIKSRINQTVELIEEIREPSTSVEVLGHFLFNPFSVIIADDTALVIPYFLSRGGRTVPLFRYEETGADCYLRSLINDTEKLRMDAENIGRRAGSQQEKIVPFRSV